ncbi:MAG: hypothetical protein AAGA92_10730 [Planctomycetota bacterium]
MCRRFPQLLLIAALLVLGCKAQYKEPTIEEFNGRLMKGGDEVSFPEGQKTVLRLIFHKNGEHFGIPINADGTFDIGWMPIGTYSATLEQTDRKRSGREPVLRHDVPGGMTIVEGQTKYTIDLGEGFGS